MSEVLHIVAAVRAELAAELRDRVRGRLYERSPEWLIEQLLDLALAEDGAAGSLGLPSIPHQAPPPAVEEDGEGGALDDQGP
ncbi:hypothetical protein DPM19_31215 [Actinomadura craniellae]|uniref:Uncharacterized protein n=1 Tax=Actinomadura craniellae TaxID=2231787 RepID=A0A365GWN7_9ACTN|nr:hypothetical protein [Actinomadura craniellae]RAY11229.1 hypothetical protein DPM19_31215 [Actinomadura craniellae]